MGIIKESKEEEDEERKGGKEHEGRKENNHRYGEQLAHANSSLQGRISPQWLSRLS